MTAASFDGDGSALTGVGIGTQGNVNTLDRNHCIFVQPSIVTKGFRSCNNYGVFGPLASVGATIRLVPVTPSQFLIFDSNFRFKSKQD